jgi:hypothetical protein
LHRSLKLRLLFLSLFKLPLNSVHKLLLRSHMLQFFVPLHAVFFESLNAGAVVI